MSERNRNRRSPASFSLLATVAALVVGVAATSLASAQSVSPVAESASPSASPSTSASGDVAVLTLPQLQAELEASQADGLERTVIANVELDSSVAGDHPSPQCLRAEGCPRVVGEIVGVPGRPVWASPELAALGSEALPADNGLLALTFGAADVITMLGVVVPYDQTATTVAWPASAAGVAPAESGVVATAIVVYGWLSWSGALPCPGSPQPTPPPNSPFETCPGAWITLEPHQPWHGNTMTPPTDGIRVQWEAYQNFAARAGSGGNEFNDPAVRGTWLLQLVEDPRPDADPKRGWQVIGRLDEPRTAVTP